MTTKPNPNDAIPTWLHASFVLSSLAVLVFFGIAIARETRRPVTVEQRIVEALGVVDRCESCHDLASHPGNALADHPVERFGCTPCHGGQGLATDKDNAHRAHLDWERPLYTEVEREAACGSCHRDAPAGLDRLARGRKALSERGCAGCHEIPGLGPPDLAPALDGLAAKLQPAWVRAWLTEPRALNETHSMPKFALSGEQNEALVAFLFSTERPRLDALPADTEASAERGQTAFATRRCATCHRLEGRGGTLGPPLDTAGAKLDKTWLYNYLTDVHRLRPASRMPGFRLPPAEAADIVAYASEQLVPDSAELPWSKHAGAPDDKLAARGKELFVELGCHGCHALAGVPTSRASVSLAGFGDRRVGELPATATREHLPDIPTWVARKVLEPRAFEIAGALRSTMPAYAMTAEEARDIGIAIGALRARPVPSGYLRSGPIGAEARLPTGATLKLVERFRCLVCHQVGGRGGDVSRVPLDGVASRLSRPWLDEFLRDPATIRMEQAERMPVLGLGAADATRLANWLEASLADERITAQAPATLQEVAAGRKLYTERGCASCHVAEGVGEIKAPVLDGASRRLRLEYAVALLERGAKLAPSGQHVPEVYPLAEARAMAAYVLSLAPPPVGEENAKPKSKP